MSVLQHRLLLLRHGETEWSKSGRHTSRTDLDLTDTGREQAKLAAEALADLQLQNPLVVSSPRQRAQVTAELAGLNVDEVSPLLAEWDYGDYEGITTPQIRETVPDWLVWTHGCPDGESVADVSARADSAALRNVVNNLLSNAIRFAPEGSEVQLRIDKGRPGHARVYVIDAGPGVPESEREKLFRRFVRINQTHGEPAADAGTEYSTGLGLAIAKSDIEEMNGFLWYEDAPGGGSVFAFELPLG